MKSGLHVLHIAMHASWVIDTMTCAGAHRVHERELSSGAETEQFPLWLRERCVDMSGGDGADM